MPPSTADEPHRAVRQVDVLDRLDRVERHAGGGHERAAGLDRELLARAEQLVGGGDHRAHVLGDGRRAAIWRVGDGEPAAEVVGAEVAERGDRLDREPPRREVEELRADVDVQAAQVGPRASPQPLDRARRVGEREAELRARVAGQDRGVRVGDDARRDPDHHLDRARRCASSLSISSKLSTTIRAPASAAARSSCADFALPCRMIRRPLKPAFSASASSPPRRDVDGQALLLEHAQHRRARERLGGEHDLPVPHRGPELARAGAQVVLGDGVERRAELARQLDRVAAADEQAAVLDRRRLGVQVTGRGGHGAAC